MVFHNNNFKIVAELQIKLDLQLYFYKLIISLPIHYTTQMGHPP